MTKMLFCAACVASVWVSSAEVLKFEYDKPSKDPIVFSAESWAEKASAGDYCLWLDIHYADGTATWGSGDAYARCRYGTHDWEKTTGVFRPKKPVKKISFNALFRHATRGTVKFRNMLLERREPRKGEPTVIAVTDYPRTRAPEDAGRGPTTVSADAFAVWTADSMSKVTPCTYPTKEDLSVPAAIRISLARNERESAQICITCGTNLEWKACTLELPKLVNAKGVELKGAFKWERVGYIPRMKGYAMHPFAPDPSEKWIPDPLLPAAPFRVRSGSTQGAWLTVFAAPDAIPGVYAGNVKVCGDNGARFFVPVTVTVGSSALPKTFSTWNSFSVMDGFTRLHYKERFKTMKRESWDVMLDHRLSPDDISRFNPPDIDDLLYARERGMNLFNILNIVPQPKDPNTPIVYTTTSKVLFSDWFYPSFRDRVVKYVEQLKKHGLDKMAYIYGFDEQGKEFYPAIDMFWRNLKRDVPGIPLMSTSFAYRDMANGVTNLTPTARSCDWFCPLTARWKPSLSDELRKEGKKVWWYTCCSPIYPYANFASLEFPFIEGRLIGWMTHLYRADGFLFWIVNFWRSSNSLLDESDTYLKWDSSMSNYRNGDGVLMYPGKDHILPSIRLANVRDGIEDGELLKMFSENGRAAEADAACRKIFKSLESFSRDPAVLRSVREPLLGVSSGKE